MQPGTCLDLRTELIFPLVCPPGNMGVLVGTPGTAKHSPGALPFPPRLCPCRTQLSHGSHVPGELQPVVSECRVGTCAMSPACHQRKVSRSCGLL